MRDTYIVAVEGLAALKSIDELPLEIVRAAKLAVNSTARRGLPQAGRMIRSEVAFPASYLSGKNGRLAISQFATDNKLEAKISGRRRPTSLARFVKGSTAIGGAKRKPGVRVEVKPGAAVRLPRAFLIRLRAGTASLDTKSNLGLAVRTKPGTQLKATSGAKKIGKNLWLLYGPSVDQVFVSRQGTGVAEQMAPETADFLEREFLRLVDLKL